MCIILYLVKYKSVVLFVAYFFPEAVCKLKFFHNQQLKIIEKIGFKSLSKCVSRVLHSTRIFDQNWDTDSGWQRFKSSLIVCNQVNGMNKMGL